MFRIKSSEWNASILMRKPSLLFPKTTVCWINKVNLKLRHIIQPLIPGLKRITFFFHLFFHLVRWKRYGLLWIHQFYLKNDFIKGNDLSRKQNITNIPQFSNSDYHISWVHNELREYLVINWMLKVSAHLLWYLRLTIILSWSSKWELSHTSI